MHLKDKVALIIGGARMGKAIGQDLARRGCHLVFSYRSSRDSAMESAAAAEQLGVQASAAQADVRTSEEAARLMKEVESRFGRLDCLVNLASIYEKVPLQDIDRQRWDDNLTTHSFAAFALSVEAAKLMRSNGTGRIIHFTDWIAASGRPRYKEYLPYYVAKMSVLGLTEALALELAPEILVNSIAPGPILPPPDLSKEEYDEVARATPLGRWGGPEEIARTVAFLLESDFITGECVRVDGGRHLK